MRPCCDESAPDDRSAPATVRCGAFTLVELLAVIAIIAVLIALLIPSLSAVRRQAERARCLATQKQIGAGVLSHATTHRGYYPLCGMLEDLPPGQLGVTPESLGDPGRARYTYAGESYYSGITLAPWQLAVATQFGHGRAPLGSSLAQMADAEFGNENYLKHFLCASHARHPTEVPESMIYYGGNLIWMITQSYAVNEAVFGRSRAMGRYEGQASRVRRPASTMMLMDGQTSAMRAYWFTYQGRPVNWITLINKVPTRDGPITLADALAGNDRAGDPENFDRIRHRGQVNVLFFDGHAETRPISEPGLRDVFLIAR